jgi:hypothetical protein
MASDEKSPPKDERSPPEESAQPKSLMEVNPPRKVEETDLRSAPATRKELWSYYAYYAGNNGIGSFQ